MIYLYPFNLCIALFFIALFIHGAIDEARMDNKGDRDEKRF